MQEYASSLPSFLEKKQPFRVKLWFSKGRGLSAEKVNKHSRQVSRKCNGVRPLAFLWFQLPSTMEYVGLFSEVVGLFLLILKGCPFVDARRTVTPRSASWPFPRGTSSPNTNRLLSSNSPGRQWQEECPCPVPQPQNGCHHSSGKLQK